MRPPHQASIAVALAVLLLWTASCAPRVRPASGRWQPALESGCLVWDPLPQPEETITWSGACVDGKASGQGTEVSRYRADGGFREERYIGSMQGGRLHGRGTLFYENGDRYEGDFADGRRVGRGTYIHASGDRYDGDFRNDRRTGHGTFTYHQGGRYEGEFVDGLFDGTGTFTFSDGSRYEGSFKGGMANGPGALRQSTGEVITGNWSSGCLRQGDRVGTVGTTREKCGFK